MVEKVYIKNYALIDELELTFDYQFNVITGETGAGKSIIVDAMMLLLGGRATTESIRQGNSKAIIEGIFNIEKYQKVQSLLEENQLLEFGNTVIVRREITSKLSRAFINDIPVNLNFLKNFGELMVDFHGQHDHQLLLKSDNHINLIDSLIDFKEEKREYFNKFNRLKELIDKYKELIHNKQNFLQQKDYYEFELKEINKINPQQNEYTTLESDLKIKENSELLYQLSSDLANILYNKENSIYDELMKASKILNQLTDIDKSFENFENDLNSAIIIIEELAKFSSSYADNIDFNPETIEMIRERLSKLNILIKKYNSIDNVLARREELEKLLNISENFDEEILKLEKEILKQKKDLYDTAVGISEKRKDFALKFEENIDKLLLELGFNFANFKVIFDTIDTNDDSLTSMTFVDKEKIINFTEDGIDKVEFYISTNKGEQPKPLSIIASGGEVSRIMLAIKSIAAGSYQLPILIFDEIDTGISGRIAQKVGIAMKNLSKLHQIISITHLPQICALSTQNIFVDKIEKDNRTIIKAKILNDEEKLREVARLISGENISESAINSAKALIQAI